MSAARVRRGSNAKGRGAKSTPRKAAARPTIGQAKANRVATWAFGAFVVAIAGVAIVALDVPAKIGLAAGEAVGDAGFRVESVDIKGLRQMNPRPVYAIALDQQTTAMPLVDVEAIRARLLKFGWVKDARVSRRFPDTLVIDIVERKPAALWQDDQRLSLIDAEGVVLDRVPVSRMPDLPLLVGKGANIQAVPLDTLLSKAPALKAQLVSASWIGERRWDLSFQSGETIALPEGEAAAMAALTKFAKMDKSAGLLGRGMLRFDLRVPDKMIVRLPREPGEPIIPEPVSES
ncbi:FtsQ-type POTRA domain-containing protein [Sphingomonas sp. LY29]|uniref:cell division protein FtsQ/DivIB n=1 Tax=Sphingomonas sp. LY29 TaxID=3095341 RepID=UPI002D7681A1|nr:FtsQ-type POTRA domain-containing protein [Sphingomonas sp. LY29]WRP25400.1 FtsQ-type POTRA domain-containing protein [Sphingomonas sp. LY29]